MKIFRFTFILSILALQLLNGCGLRYTPPELPEEYQARRRKAVENYMKMNLGKDSVSYSSIAFGQTQIIKPKSFQILDSLYELKYNQNRSDKELEEQIKIQKEIAENEKDKIKYLEFLVFNFGKRDSLQVIETEILVNKEFEVESQEVLSAISLPESQLEMYKKYLFEESFIFPETSATYAEERFYALYKDKISQLLAEEKNRFIQHTLRIMDWAHRKKSLQTVDLLTAISSAMIRLEAPELQIDKFNEVYTDENEAYWFTVDCSMSTGKKVQYYFSFDTYLELLKKERIE